MTPEQTSRPQITGPAGLAVGPPGGPRAAPLDAPRPPAPAHSPWPVAARFLATGLLLAAYFTRYDWLIELLSGPLEWLERLAGAKEPSLAAPRVAAVTVFGALLAAVWWKVIRADARFHAPILITYILMLANAGYGVLENHYSDWLSRLTGGRFTSYSPTFVVMAATMALELALSRFLTGRWPHLASAYISGISAGILVKSPFLWPFVFCGLISITSKYVLRVGGRHLWNPTNLGMTAILFLGADATASLSVQAGNEIWPVVLIWALGSLILYRLKLLHIPLVFVAAFIPLSFLRSVVTGNPFAAEVAPVTWPMFQLYIFFMITDPKTVVNKPRWKQCLVAVLIAVVETVLRLAFRDIHSLYHALFIVGPIANLIDIRYGAKPKGAPGAAPGHTPATATTMPAGDAGKPLGITT
jgi:hypothetical protein